MENEVIRFDPPRRRGVLFHLAVLIALLALAGWLFIQATQAELGPLFLFYLLGALFLAVPLPVFFSRLMALNRGYYLLERDGVRLRWGMRAEDIPMTDILWVRLGEGLLEPLSLPAPRWPGAVLGQRLHAEVGEIEFMAASTENLVLIGTPQRVYAISPGDRNQFLRAFQLQTEMGSLSPLPAFSAHPTFLLADVWGSPVARIFFVFSLVLSLALFMWVGLAVPGLETVALGFSASGAPVTALPAVQLFLLPVLNILLFLGTFVLSLYFHRQSSTHPLAYLLWFSSALTNVLFLSAIYVILKNL